MARKLTSKKPRTTQKRAAKSGKSSVAIIGTGRLGSALAVALAGAGFEVRELVGRTPSKARGLAKKVGARAVGFGGAALDSDIIWLTVSDSAIRDVAEQLSSRHDQWADKIVFHSSGALTGDELSALRARGAHVASVHPLMTFSGVKQPQFQGAWMALEGDSEAVRAAENIANILGAITLHILPDHKPAYHA